MSSPEMVRADHQFIRSQIRSEFPNGPRHGLDIPTAEQWERANEIAAQFGKSINPASGSHPRNLAYLRSQLVRMYFANMPSSSDLKFPERKLEVFRIIFDLNPVKGEFSGISSMEEATEVLGDAVKLFHPAVTLMDVASDGEMAIGKFRDPMREDPFGDWAIISGRLEKSQDED